MRGAQLGQLVECQTLDHKVVGTNLTRGAGCGVVSLSKTLHLHSHFSTGSTQENFPI